MRTPRILALIALMTVVTAHAQSNASQVQGQPNPNENDAAAIRALLADGYETSWNNHQPATAVTPDKCAEDAIFINVTGGWVKGCQLWADMITPLHAPGGPFHDVTRRHAVEELRFIRADVAIAVVRTFDKKQAGVAAPGEDTRGLVVLVKDAGRWRMVADQNARIQATVDGNR